MNYDILDHASKDHADFVVVNWCMGNMCNFSCTYCPSGLHDGSVPWRDLTQVIAFCDRVLDHYGLFHNKTLYFEFTGGEISLWKHFPTLCKHLKGRDAKVGFISNGSRTMRWWGDIRQHVDHVCLSFHPEQSDTIIEGKSYKDHFVDVVRFMSETTRVHVNIMMTPDNFLELYAYSCRINKIPNISMALQPLIKDFGEEVYPYTAHQKHILDNQHELVTKHIRYTRSLESYRGAMAMVSADGTRKVQSPQKFISTGSNDWSGWKCYAGVEQIIVDMDGSVHRGWCKVGGQIGHVLDQHLNLPSDPVICNKSMCHCNFDIMCKKER